MMTVLKSFWTDEEGAAAIEYALIAGLIALVIVGAVTLTGVELNAVWGAIAARLGAVTP